MGSNNYAAKIRKVIEEAAHIKKSYDTIKESMSEEFQNKKKISEDLEELLQKTSEAYNRGEASKTDFEKVKKDHEIAQKVFNDINNRFLEIDQHMYIHLDKVINQLNEIKEKYREEVIKEATKLKYQLLKAKREFLFKISNLRQSFSNFLVEDDEYQEIYEELGFYNLVDSLEALSEGVTDDNDAVISKREIYDVIQTGQIPTEIEKELKYAENQGFLS